MVSLDVNWYHPTKEKAVIPKQNEADLLFFLFCFGI
jgi:hypothetical protein